MRFPNLICEKCRSRLVEDPTPNPLSSEMVYETAEEPEIPCLVSSGDAVLPGNQAQLNPDHGSKQDSSVASVAVSADEIVAPAEKSLLSEVSSGATGGAAITGVSCDTTNDLLERSDD